MESPADQTSRHTTSWPETLTVLQTQIEMLGPTVGDARLVGGASRAEREPARRKAICLARAAARLYLPDRADVGLFEETPPSQLVKYLKYGCVRRLLQVRIPRTWRRLSTGRRRPPRRAPTRNHRRYRDRVSSGRYALDLQFRKIVGGQVSPLGLFSPSQRRVRAWSHRDTPCHLRPRSSRRRTGSGHQGSPWS